MQLNIKNVRLGLLTLAIALVFAPVALAQSIVDARRIEFTPSADHAIVDANGTGLVQSYLLGIFVTGGTTPTQTVTLGKPALDVDGMIRLDFVSLLTTPLTAGVVYETRVSAVGPGGSTPSVPSNTFGFTAVCAPTISPASQSFSSAGGSGSVNVATGAGCTWTAASNVSWLSVSAGAAGAGNGGVTFAVAATTATTQRTGTLTIAGRTFTVTQSGVACAFSISPTSQTFGAAGGSGSVAVTTTAGCAWTATSGAGWVTVAGGASGTGSGTVSFSAAANTTTAARSATLTIAGSSFTVTETAPCSFVVSPLSLTPAALGGAGTLTVTTQAGCTWTSSTSTSWITVTGSGTSSGTASYTVGVNATSTSRTGIILVAGRTAIVTQAQPGPPAPPTNVRVLGG